MKEVEELDFRSMDLTEGMVQVRLTKLVGLQKRRML